MKSFANTSDLYRKKAGLPVIGEVVEPALQSRNETYCFGCNRLIAYTKDPLIVPWCSLKCQMKAYGGGGDI